MHKVYDYKRCPDLVQAVLESHPNDLEVKQNLHMGKSLDVFLRAGKKDTDKQLISQFKKLRKKLEVK